MIFLTAGSSSTGGFLQLVGLLLLFVLILYAAYFITKWLAKKGIIGGKTQNIQFIETYRISQTKQVSILKIGGRYHAVGITKDHIEYLTEVPEEELHFEEVKPKTEAASFQEILKSTTLGIKNRNKKEK